MEHTRWEETLSALFPPDKCLRILHAGCDSGFLVAALTGLAHNVVEIPVSPVMDCTKINFENESFDAVVCYEVMSSLSDEKQAWSEFKRVLKKEGHVVVFDTGRIAFEHAQAQGFSHCRFMDFDELNCMSARKPLVDEYHIIPQIALFKRHIQTTKKQIQLYQSWCQSVGTPYPEYTVLNVVSLHPNGMRPSDISTALVIPPQTLTRILSGLQRNGYINRKVNNRDQRSSVITITEAGVEKMKPLQAKLRDIEKRAFIDFRADELADLSGLSDKLLKSLEAAFQNQTGELI
ncbi:MAG: methyltransferase domain-containing protein [Oscillospiraceae bacterium]|nr:methyltransferase domain-containing protein [Oscillospiraceae bacterium]